MDLRSILPILLLVTAGLAAPAPAASLPAAGLPTSIGQAIVGFDEGALPAVAPGDLLAGLPVLDVEPRGDYLVLAAPDLERVRAALATTPGVAYIEDDQVLTATAVPSDPRYGSQYGPAMMGAHDAWTDAGYGDTGIVVAVLDTGIRATHEDLAGRITGGWDYVNNDATPNDDCGHGTHVAGTVAAIVNNGKGVVGMAQASIMPMKVLGPVGGLFTITCSGSQSDINAAIYDATDAGADIVSMSLGGGGYASSGEAAVNYAYGKGTLVVAAAGNDGASNSVDYPAAYANAIAVAALTSSKTRASYSDAGPQVEIAAPGSGVWSTYNGGNSDYRSLDGTSMATPHVAGAFALALACDATASATALRSKMASTAEDLGASGRDNVYGHGLMRIDLLIDTLSCGTPPPNTAPVAAFTTSTSGLAVSVDGTGSSDADGDPLTYAWDFGDGLTATGATASHAYAANGTYTITLEVDDGHGATDTTTAAVSVSSGSAPTDPDPSTPNLANGVAESVVLSSGGEAHYKIHVPPSATQLVVEMTGPACGVFGCSFDADLYVREGARATDSAYDCRPYASGSDETCTLSSPVTGWWYVRADAYSGSGTVEITATHDGTTTPPPPNTAPTASFTTSTSGLGVTVDGTGSSDADGDALSYAWDFGDGDTATGATASHTYASAGTYTISLTVDDGNGGTDSTTASVTVTAPADPDPSTPNLANGVAQTVHLAAGGEAHLKIEVPTGASSLDVEMTGPACGVFSCPLDADLYVREGARATDSNYDCRPYASGSDESCSFTSPSAAWWYVRLDAYSGSGDVTIKATYT